MILSLARHWSSESQQRARRNAMLAATECAQRRAEREDVEDFLLTLRAPVAADAGVRAAHG